MRFKKFIVVVYQRVRQKYWNFQDNVSSKKLIHRLQNDNFSILCSNCLGGVIYHRLSKQFLSPTINLYMDDMDFIRFATKIKMYLGSKLVPVESELPFPVGKLDDILIFFNHSSSFEEAERDWNRRVARINYNNLYLIMYDKGELTESDLRNFENIPCRNRALLSERDWPGYDFVVKVKSRKSPRYQYPYFGRTMFGKRYFETFFDYVAWLNS